MSQYLLQTPLVANYSTQYHVWTTLVGSKKVQDIKAIYGLKAACKKQKHEHTHALNHTNSLCMS